MAAVDFAVSHDDGMNMGDLKADILIVGVSRLKPQHQCIWHIVAIRLPIMRLYQGFHFLNTILMD